MRMAIRWQLSLEEWESRLRHCPRATFYHSSRWYGPVCETLGYRMAPALIEFDDTWSLLPLALRPKYRGILQEAVSGVYGGYGGLVSPSPLSPEQVQAAYRAAIARYPQLWVYSNPFEFYYNAPLPGDGFRMMDTVTQALALADLERLRAGYARSRKKAARRVPEDLHLEIIEAPGLTELERFYQVYEACSREWKTQRWVRSKEFFGRLFEAAGPCLRLLVVSRHGEPLGVRLVALYGIAAVGLVFTCRRSEEYQEISTALTEATLDLCYREGMRYYDFGASGALAGVRYFKESFGAIAFPLAAVEHEGPLGSAMRAAREAAMWGAKLVRT